MSSYTVLQNSFPSGEISPLWKGRSNTEFYRTGLALCENFLPMNPSGLRRRPGTTFLTATINNANALIIPIVVNGNVNIVVELIKGDACAWFANDISNKFYISQATKSVLNFTDTLENLRYATNKNSIWFVSSKIPPFKIDLTISGTTISLSASVVTFTGDVTFSSVGDYPSVVAFKGGRLFLGGTDNIPNGIFASRSPDMTLENPDRYTDFTYRDEIAGELTITNSNAFDMQDSELGKPLWFLNSKFFLVGSSNIVFTDNGGIVAPETFDISANMREGSANIQARGLKNYVIYAGSSATTMHIMIYDTDTKQYISKSISENSSHLFSSGIKDFCICFMPDPVVWVILNNGTILSCVVNMSNGLFTGWSKHTLSPNGDTPIRITNISKENETDSLYIVMKKPDNEYYLSELKLNDIFATGTESYLDNKQTFTFVSDTNRFQCFETGDNVTVVIDNKYIEEHTIDNSGYLNTTKSGKNFVVGFSFTSVVGFLSQEQPANGQSSFGNVRRVSKARIRVYQSFGGYIGMQYEDTDKMYKLLTERYGSLKYNEVPSLTNEDITIDIKSSNTTNGTIYVKTDFVTPLNILALKEQIELLEV